MTKQQENATMLMAALSRLACERAEIVELKDVEGATVLHWKFTSNGRLTFLGSPPAITCFPDGAFCWTLKGQKFRFSLDDINALDPEGVDLENRVSLTVREIASHLRGLDCEPRALAAALKLHTEIRARLCAFSVKVAYPTEAFCAILRCAYDAWRYRVKNGSANLSPPFSEDKYEQAAQRIAALSAQSVVREVISRAGDQGPSLFATDPSGCSRYLFY